MREQVVKKSTAKERNSPGERPVNTKQYPPPNYRNNNRLDNRFKKMYVARLLWFPTFFPSARRGIVMIFRLGGCMYGWMYVALTGGHIQCFRTSKTYALRRCKTCWGVCAASKGCGRLIPPRNLIVVLKNYLIILRYSVAGGVRANSSSNIYTDKASSKPDSSNKTESSSNAMMKKTPPSTPSSGVNRRSTPNPVRAARPSSAVYNRPIRQSSAGALSAAQQRANSAAAHKRGVVQPGGKPPVVSKGVGARTPTTSSKPITTTSNTVISSSHHYHPQHNNASGKPPVSVPNK